MEWRSYDCVVSLVQAYDGTRFYGWASAIGVEKIMPNRQFPENAADGHYVAEGHYVYAAQGCNAAKDTAKILLRKILVVRYW